MLRIGVKAVARELPSVNQRVSNSVFQTLPIIISAICFDVYRHLLDDSLLDSPAVDYHSSNEKILDSSDADSKSGTGKSGKSNTSEMELKNTLSRLTLQSQCIFKVR